MSNSLWVFGYGSLLWFPGFKFTASVAGAVKGFSRRFYQGNVTHRGVPGKPGRVATLIEDNNSEVLGVAFEVANGDALPYLDQREVRLGGYTTVFVEFLPCDGSKPFPVLVYAALKDSPYWLGPAPQDVIADQITSSSGPTGHNVEYLLRLAETHKSLFPGHEDSHLFELERLVRARIAERGLSLEELMGPTPPVPQPTASSNEDEGELPLHQEFAPSLPSKKLRCLSI